MDPGSSARELSDITAVEPNLCYRTPREIRRAIHEDRWFAARRDGELAGFLFVWPYTEDWIELGTGYVRPDHRGEGCYTELHERATAHLERTGRRAFEFPGNPAAEHVLRKCGFARSSYRELPWSVWSSFLRRRRSAPKLRSYLDMVQSDDAFHSLKLYTYDPDGREPKEPGRLAQALLP